MGDVKIVWDEGKNKKNIADHGVSFEEAKTIFYDPNARLIHDPDHSADEERFIILGISKKMHLLVVCHCYRENDTVIRLISARKATAKEKRQYTGNGGR
jgi:uncharacterized DUF497 family protein